MAPVLKLTRGALAAVLAAGLLAACASAGREERVRSRPETMRGGNVAQFERLAAQSLEPGQCGLFLWAQSSQQPVFIMAAFDDPPQARVRVDGRERILQRTSVEGVSVHGHYEVQTYRSGNVAITVDVTFDNDRRLRDGAVVERGVIRSIGSDGSETIVPVGGMVACEN